jgi:hypothetical protein
MRVFALSILVGCAGFGCTRWYPRGEFEDLDDSHQTREAKKRCEPLMRALARGSFYAAEGERSPRARYLFERECEANEEVPGREDYPWLSKSQPELCERLRRNPPAEGFLVRWREEYEDFSFEYVGYEGPPSKPTIVVTYSRFRVDPLTFAGDACALHAWEPEGVTSYDLEKFRNVSSDSGILKWSSPAEWPSIEPVSLYLGGLNGSGPMDGTRVTLVLGEGRNAVFARQPRAGENPP